MHDKQTFKLTVIGAALALGIAGAATAHHSYAVFDATQKVTITGTVRKFDFINPHTWLVVAVADNIIINVHSHMATIHIPKRIQPMPVTLPAHQPLLQAQRHQPCQQ